MQPVCVWEGEKGEEKGGVAVSCHDVLLAQAYTKWSFAARRAVAILLPQWLCTASVIASINKVFKEFIYYCSAAASKVKCDAAEWKVTSVC